MDDLSSSKHLQMGGVAMIATAMAAVAIGVRDRGGRHRTIGDPSDCDPEG
jgi:hypothetical protein